MDPLFEFGLLIKAGQRDFERRANDAMRPLGLTGAQADAITVIEQAGPLSLKELGELLIAEAGHPSRLVDRLVEAGLVARRPADGDRRRIVLSLTQKGRRLEKRVEAARNEVLELGRALIGDRDLEPALELLRELAQFSPFGELVTRRRELFEGRTTRAG
ncbi:MAG: MarR family transcriptional regulator, organic hydroperoxide resistance regulator [Thermoleophilaceae bacterium]|nr:MarR family transcriptional regulator, organic hydroperoxide resistance regulator [Thermoleophilaceae bacterium]